MENENYYSSLEKLKKSPLFSMSLGSKELYHSNFWAWIMEREYGKEFIKFFFPEIDIGRECSILREYKHRDIVIVNSGFEYVIENKIKSYADEEQLKKYPKKEGVITGLKKPPFTPPEGWRIVLYDEIASKLLDICEFVKNDFEKQIIKEYAIMINDIYDVITSALKSSEGLLLFNNEFINSLADVRMLDVFKKIKGDDFVYCCSKDLFSLFRNSYKLPSNWNFEIERTFNNGKCTLTFRFIKWYGERDNDRAFGGQLGIQIEDDQYRYFFEPNERINKKINESFNVATNSGWFDPSFNKKESRKIFGNETKMSSAYCSYNRCWLYQYFNLVNLQYESIKNMIKNDLIKALSIIEQLDNEVFKVDLLNEYVNAFNEKPLKLMTTNYNNEIYQSLMIKAIKRGYPLSGQEIEKAFSNIKRDLCK